MISHGFYFKLKWYDRRKKMFSKINLQKDGLTPTAIYYTVSNQKHDFVVFDIIGRMRSV